jgi:lipopolysaccharide export system protein LptA
MSRNSNKWQAVLLLLCLAGGLSQPVAGEEKANGSGKQGKAAPGTSLVDSLSLTSRHEPIHIRSQVLEFFYNDKRILYRGDVMVTQGEVTVKCDLLTVTYEEPETTTADTPKPIGVTADAPKPASVSSRQRLKEIVAEGNVDLTSGDRRATGKKLVFDEVKRTAVLSGNAVLQEGGNQVTGERVTVFLDEKRSVVEGGGGDRRAEMLLIPQPQEDEKKGATTP